MMPRLPPELLTHIALYPEADISTFIVCARVCRQWQSVFENLIYRNMKVESDDLKLRRGVISLLQFRNLVSGHNEYRRSFIQRLEYTVIIPHKLLDYRAVKLEGYHDQNPVREANDRAFWTGLKSLFEFLRTWDKSPKFTLALAVQGRDEGLEPDTEIREDAYAWQVELDGDQVVGQYRARFPDASMLPLVTCFDGLSFEWTHGLIWAGTAMQIAESCLTLQQLHLDMRDLSRPDHLWYMRDRRQGTFSGSSFHQ